MRSAVEAVAGQLRLRLSRQKNVRPSATVFSAIFAKTSKYEHDEHEYLSTAGAEEFRRPTSYERGYGTSSEYVRESIRRDQQRQHVRAQVLDATASGLAHAVTDEYFESLRGRVRNAAK
jgi:antitoxin ParD1/3/4